MQNAGGIDSITNAFSSSGAFTTNLILSDDTVVAASSITPKIKYGDSQEEAVFASGVAILDVYTKSEVNSRI